jgi:hypothetical protein
MHKVEAIVPEPSFYGCETWDIFWKVEKLKKPGIYQIPVGLIHTWCKTLHSEIHRVLSSVWNNGDLPEQWKESIIIIGFKNDDEADGIN